MTRMAPTSRALRTARTAAEHASATVLAARWRVGLRGRLVVALCIDPDSNGLIGSVELADAGNDAPDGTHTVRAIVSRAAGEVCVEVTESSEARLAGVRCTVIGCTDPRAPLLLTDLPSALGMRGGTYVLEHVHAALG
jgi:hypothetical protein